MLTLICCLGATVAFASTHPETINEKNINIVESTKNESSKAINLIKKKECTTYYAPEWADGSIEVGSVTAPTCERATEIAVLIIDAGC